MTTRRQFLKGAAATAAFTILPRHVLGGKGYIAPSDQLTKGIIGFGGIALGAALGAAVAVLINKNKKKKEQT